jgi:hypothetical protein
MSVLSQLKLRSVAFRLFFRSLGGLMESSFVALGPAILVFKGLPDYFVGLFPVRCSTSGV